VNYVKKSLIQTTRRRVLVNFGLACVAQVALASLTIYAVYWNLAPIFVPRNDLWWLTDCGLGSGFWLIFLLWVVLLPALAVLVITGTLHVYFTKRDPVDWNAWLESDEEEPPKILKWLNVRRRWPWAPWYLTFVDLFIFAMAYGIGDFFPRYAG